MSTDSSLAETAEAMQAVKKMPQLRTKATRKRKAPEKVKDEPAKVETKEALLDLESNPEPTALTPENIKKPLPVVKQSVEKVVYVPQQLRKEDVQLIRNMMREEISQHVTPLVKQKSQASSYAPLQDFMESRLLVLTNTLQSMQDKMEKLQSTQSAAAALPSNRHEDQYESYEDEVMHNYHTGGEPPMAMRHNYRDYEVKNEGFSYF